MAFVNFDDEHAGASQGFGKLFLVGLISLVTVFGSTLAANISLGTGSIEFGQGVLATTACSGNTSLTMTPRAQFVNASGAGAFYFKSITVSNIPLGCQGSDFQINAYDSSSAVALALFDSTAKNVIVYDGSSAFQVGGGLTGFTVASGVDSFTVTFTNPVALASNVSRITIQSAIHALQTSEQCQSNGQRPGGGACRVGDIGTGGGTIFYASATAFTATGASCNTNCHYLEVAPKGWASLADYPNNISYNGQIISVRTDVNVDPILVWSDGNFTGQTRSTIAVGTAIGTGYINTQQVKNNTPSGVHDSWFAFNAALAYAGNSGTSTVGQWFLPSLKELNEFCKYVRGQTNDLGDPNVECTVTGTTLNTAFGLGADLYMSSTYGLSATGEVDGYRIGQNTNPLVGRYYASYGNQFRPVRVS
jgi:hypothetical protein